MLQKSKQITWIIKQLNENLGHVTPSNICHDSLMTRNFAVKSLLIEPSADIQQRLIDIVTSKPLTTWYMQSLQGDGIVTTCALWMICEPVRS